MKGHVIDIRTKDLLIIGVTLNGCQVNESSVKDVNGERKLKHIMVVLCAIMSRLANIVFFFVL
jgi:uncharacterized membrane protein YadS